MYGKERSNNMIGDIRKFRFWCQKVLPLVYDDSLSYYEVLCKVVQYLNKVIEDVNSIPEYIDAVIDEKLSDEHLQEFIEQFVLNIEGAISSNNEGDNTNSSADYNVGQMLWLNGKLYRVIRQIDAGDTFIVDTNIALVNFEDLFNEFIDEVKHDISANDDGVSATATQNWTAGTWIWLNDVLYKAKVDITEGTAYVLSGDNANVEQITVEGEIKDVADAVEDEATAREEADGDLQTAIENEVEARGDADDALEDSLTNKIKTHMYINVEDYGADPTGATSSNTSIADAVTNAKGGRVVFEKGEYLLDTDVDAYSNEFDFSRSEFTGSGAGDPSAYQGKFASPLTNAGNKIVQLMQKANIDDIKNPVGNGVVLNSHELNQSNSNDFITVTGSIQSGSSVITVDDATGIDRGDGVLLSNPTGTGWLSGNTRANTMRVVSVSGNNITIGPDNSNGNGNAVATPWSGDSITNGTFVIRKRRWQVVDFHGIESPEAVNPDRINWVKNDILNLRGSIGNVYEIELNNFGSEANEYSRGIFITGRGNGSMPMAGIDIQRAYYEASQNWNIGVSINSSAVGIQIKASKGIVIDTEWDDAYTQTTQELYTGIEFDNISDAVRAVRPLFAGKNIVNGASAIVLQRANDATPAGFYLQCMNSDATDNIFTVDTNGTVMAGIYKVKQFVNVDNTVTLKGYIIMQDANGDPVKVMVAN